MESSNLKYPRTVNVNFRKFNKATLTKVLRHYQVEPRKELTQNDLAVMAARMFEATVVLEDDVVDKFIEKFCYAGADQMHVSKKRTLQTRELLDREIAAPGEQVATKLYSKSPDEESSWILGNILQYDLKSHSYLVQDEDDVNRVMQLPFANVKRLGDTAQNLRRGDHVLAVFPETTSFYRAVVAKQPKAPSGQQTMWEVVVRFDDDEDESGKNPARRVPARFVLRRSDLEGEIDDNESTQSS